MRLFSWKLSFFASYCWWTWEREVKYGKIVSRFGKVFHSLNAVVKLIKFYASSFPPSNDYDYANNNQFSSRWLATHATQVIYEDETENSWNLDVECSNVYILINFNSLTATPNPRGSVRQNN